MASSPDSERRLDSSEAFELGEGYEGLGPRGRALRVSSRELLHDDFALARGDDRPSEPIEFIRDEGRTPHDVVAPRTPL